MSNDEIMTYMIQARDLLYNIRIKKNSPLIMEFAEFHRQIKHLLTMLSYESDKDDDDDDDGNGGRSDEDEDDEDDNNKGSETEEDIEDD